MQTWHYGMGHLGQKALEQLPDAVQKLATSNNMATIDSITFIGFTTRWLEVKLLRDKSKAFNTIKTIKAPFKHQSNSKIQRLCTDNAKEFTSTRFKQLLTNSGIKHELSALYTSQQNGLAERINRTLLIEQG